MASEHCQAWACGSSPAARAGIGSTMPSRTTRSGLLSAHLENMYKLLFQQQPGYGPGQERAATPHSRPAGLVPGVSWASLLFCIITHIPTFIETLCPCYTSSRCLLSDEREILLTIHFPSLFHVVSIFPFYFEKC